MGAFTRRGAMRACFMAALGLVLVACSTPPNCGAGVGASDGVVVAFSRGVRISTSIPLSITACMDGRCRAQTYSGFPTKDLRQGLFVAVMVPADTEIRASVKAVANSRLVFSGSTGAHTRMYQP